MNHGLKALLIAASTLITCIIVSLGFRMAREAGALGNHVVEELYRYRSAVEERDFMKYDGAVVYGSDVVNLMKKELSDTADGFKVTVKENKVSYSYEDRGTAERTEKAEHAEYIVPTSTYTGKVVRNENGVIVEVIFTRKE
ncbi:MAG: hypothetical protein ACI4QX_02145 [Lachnospiraceae bacterium]